MGTWLRANPSKGKKNVKDTDSAHHAAERRMEHDGHKRRKMTEKVVLFPIARPRQIQEQRAHLEREDHQQCAINPAHRLEESRRVRNGSCLTGGLLKSSDALGHVAVVDVHRIDLGKTLQRRIQLARRFLRHA